MNFTDAVKTCFSKYADFNGRAKRPEFWWFFLFLVVLNIVTSMLGGFISIVASLVTLLPSLAVGARRLHDTGRPGWWQLIVLIPVVGIIVLIVFCAQEGQAEDNAYGNAPAEI